MQAVIEIHAPTQEALLEHLRVIRQRVKQEMRCMPNAGPDHNHFKTRAIYQPLIDYDLEAAVLGILLMEPAAFGKVYGMLVPECFYNQDHLKVYEAISALYSDGHPIDLLTVQRYFYNRSVTMIGNHPAAFFLASLIRDVVISSHLGTWCLMLRELAVQRTALAITTSGIDRNEDILDVAEMVQQKLKQLTDIRSKDDWEDGSKCVIIGRLLRKIKQ